MYHPHLDDFEALLLGAAFIVFVVLVLIGCSAKGSL